MSKPRPVPRAAESSPVIEVSDPMSEDELPPTPVAINPHDSVPFLVMARSMWTNRTRRTLRDIPLGNTVCPLWFIGDVKPIREAFADDALAAGLTRVERWQST